VAVGGHYDAELLKPVWPRSLSVSTTAEGYLKSCVGVHRACAALRCQSEVYIRP
jgi:hypothetical protein